MILQVVLLVAGLAILVKGAGWLVDGASAIASRSGISTLVIGLTIVAFGTSMPELVVSVLAAFQGKLDLAVGNIMGSNVANTLLILGVSAFIRPLVIRSNTVRRELPFSIVAILVVAFMASDEAIDGALSSKLTRIDGLVLLSLFMIFIYSTFLTAKEHLEEIEAETEAPDISYSRACVLVALGVTLLPLGGFLIVENASAIATWLGVSPRVIGLTVVAFGTSLPELATCIVAARKDKADLVVGGIIGSNIFNLLWILGIGAVITPLPFAVESQLDIVVNVAASLLIFVFVFTGKRRSFLERWEGAVLCAMYVAYIAYTVA